MSEPHLPVDVLPSSEKREGSVSPEKAHYSKNDAESTTGADVASTDVLQNERDIITNIISLHDDPSLNPWTFRALFIGFGLSAFGGVLGER